MWDQADFPCALVDPDVALFDFDRDISRSVRRFVKRRFFRYLSLCYKDEYTRGLSVYVSANGIVGLEVHFTRISRLSGSRRGCALHFSLFADEHIVHVWLRVINSSSSTSAAPALVVSICQLLHSLLLIGCSRLKPHVEDCIPLDPTSHHLW